MKPVKNLVLALLFVSTLTITTYAGDLETPGFVPPPPPPPERSMTTATFTDENGPSMTENGYETSDAYYEVLKAVLSLF